MRASPDGLFAEEEHVRIQTRSVRLAYAQMNKQTHPPTHRNTVHQQSEFRMLTQVSQVHSPPFFSSASSVEVSDKDRL